MPWQPAPTALELFRGLGLDTVQIAARLGITEAEAEQQLHCQRNHERALADKRSARTRDGKIPYAGYEARP